MEFKDIYKTISKLSEEALFKEKNSKFYGYAYPVMTEQDVKSHIEKLRKQHYTARHWCYAYQLGTETKRYRANDDGEPNNSAGMPIYGQIQSYDLTNILIVVVRYFGGVKLGVGGLISAYRNAAQMAIENAQIIEKTIDNNYSIQFDYKYMSRVMRILKENKATIEYQKLELDCIMNISIRKNHSKTLEDKLSQFHEITVRHL